MVQPLVLRGDVHVLLNDLQSAKADYDQAMALSRGYPVPYRQRGRLFQSEGKIDDALADYNAAIKMAPNYYELYLDRASTCEAKGDDAQAIADYQEAIRLRPKRPAGYNGAAWLKATSENKAVRDGEAAVAAATKACALSEWKNADYVTTLAAASAESSDFKAAKSRLKQADELASEEEKEEARELRKAMSQEFARQRPYRKK
jgi:tetratricopeptide (TPR) repeat protein